MISVIVPVYDSAAWIDGVIAALSAQDFPRDRYELIFVDNGSSDDSLQRLRRAPGLRVLQEAERGSYAARNRGLQAAAGDLLAFTDADCYPEPGWLAAIAAGFGDPEAQILLGPRLAVGNSRGARLLAGYDNAKVAMICEGDDPAPYFGYTNNMAVRRAAMERHGPFELRQRGADTLFLQRLLAEESCRAVAWCPAMAVRHAELDSVASYYRKAGIYARSHRAMQGLCPVRPLAAAERWRAYRRAVSGAGPLDAAWLLALLAGGSLAWWLGGRGL